MLTFDEIGIHNETMIFSLIWLKNVDDLVENEFLNLCKFMIP